MSLRDELLAIDDRKTEELPIPRWNRTLRIRELDGIGRDQITNLYIKQSKEGGDGMPPALHEHYVVLGVIDEKGDPVFTLEDVFALRKKNGEVVKFISDAVAKLSGMMEGSLEEARKNSESEANSDSGTASP